MKFIIIISIIILLLLQIAIGAKINEIMYNPAGLDNNKEFIEIYLDNNESLENWTIADLSSNDTLITLSYIDSSYAMIVEEGYEYQNSEASYYSVGTTIGNNLNNDLDSIFLFNSRGELVDSTTYNGSIANNNGFSIEYYNGSWFESKKINGTPGEINSIVYYFNELIINTTNQTNINLTNSSISNNITNNNSAFNDSVNNMPSVCDVSINLTSEKAVYSFDEKVKYKIDLNNKSFPYIIEYWIEDIFGNVVKNRYNTTNTNQKTWTPNCEEGYVFVLNSRIAEVECNDTNNLNDNAEKYIIIKCDKSENELIEFDEEIEIADTYFGTDNSIKFGEVSRVKLYVSKGDTAKTAIEMYVTAGDEKISEITKFNMNKKQSELFVTLPLVIKSNCNEKFDEGEYELVVSGLGMVDKTNIDVVGYDSDICKTITKIEKQECKEEVCNYQVSEGDLNIKKPKIISFYTLAKKLSNQIRLFANVDCPGDCIIFLSNISQDIETRKLSNFSGKIDFNVTYSDEYFLKLSEINENKNLTMKFSDDKKQKEISINVNQSKERIVGNVQNNNDDFNIEKNKLDLTTGKVTHEPKVIFESINSKSKKLTKYFLILILGVIAGIIIWKKPF